VQQRLQQEAVKKSLAQEKQSSQHRAAAQSVGPVFSSVDTIDTSADTSSISQLAALLTSLQLTLVPTAGAVVSEPFKLPSSKLHLH
jgi:hypothetical protein